MSTNIIICNPEILGGTPVFNGTRVPVERLFDHLEQGISLDEFLEDFPSVSKSQATEVLEIAERLLTAKNLPALYVSVA